MQRYSVITLFPEFVQAFRTVGVVGRACERQLISIEALNPRDFSADRHRRVDDTAYGGGPGMVMQAGPLIAAIRHLRAAHDGAACQVIYPSPQGQRFSQQAAAKLAGEAHLIFVAGRYEGVDERVIQREVDAEWSLGDYVVSGGELPALTMIDAIARLLPGVLGDERSAASDSFSDGLFDHPHYTRPENFEGEQVPAVLLSGDHGAIRRWRREQALLRTLERRPDLLEAAELSPEDKEILSRLRQRSGQNSGNPD